MKTQVASCLWLVVAAIGPGHLSGCASAAHSAAIESGQANEGPALGLTSDDSLAQERSGIAAYPLRRIETAAVAEKAATPSRGADDFSPKHKAAVVSKAGYSRP